MCIYISCPHQESLNPEILSTEHLLAEYGNQLGFREIGISPRLVESSPLMKSWECLDGALSGIECGDICIIQLPTGNGEQFEAQLIRRIKSCQNTHVVLWIHDILPYINPFFLTWADQLVVTRPALKQGLLALSVQPDDILALPASGEMDALHAKRALLLSMEPFLKKSASGQKADSIQICYCVHDRTGNYSANVCASIKSILAHTHRDIVFQILIDDSVSQLNQKRIRATAAEGGAEVIFHLMNQADFQADQAVLMNYTFASLFRLILPDVLPTSKRIIYLDADIWINTDIGALWDTDLKENAIGAVHDIGFERGIRLADPIVEGEVTESEYFNSGVLLMDLDRVRQTVDLLPAALSYLKQHPDSHLPDQDALNVLFRHNTLLLPEKWNHFVKYDDSGEIRPLVYHFVGIKNHCLTALSPVEYRYILEKSAVPGGEEAILDDFHRESAALEDHMRQFETLIQCLRSKEKKIIWYGINTLSMKTLCSIFPPRDGDYFLCSDPIDQNGRRYGQPVKTFADLKQEVRGTFVVIALPDADGYTAISCLESIGLQNGTDYFVAPRLTASEQGGYIL